MVILPLHPITIPSGAPIPSAALLIIHSATQIRHLSEEITARDALIDDFAKQIIHFAALIMHFDALIGDSAKQIIYFDALIMHFATLIDDFAEQIIYFAAFIMHFATLIDDFAEQMMHFATQIMRSDQRMVCIDGRLFRFNKPMKQIDERFWKRSEYRFYRLFNCNGLSHPQKAFESTNKTVQVFRGCCITTFTSNAHLKGSNSFNRKTTGPRVND